MLLCPGSSFLLHLNGCIGDGGIAWGSIRDSGFGQWGGDDWRTIADVAAFAACFVSLKICALAAPAVVTAKALADLKTHGLDYAGEQFAGNIRYGALGLAGGAAFGAAWGGGHTLGTHRRDHAPRPPRSGKRQTRSATP
ncbi:hypothetical protein AB0935_03120 [Streptomyces sp. NPDC007027]|uniref:hypothetical protein n=1 Tax=Streptomyces sp. NPDC007027 TaxID=3157086 RepID=UPI0034568D21